MGSAAVVAIAAALYWSVGPLSGGSSDLDDRGRRAVPSKALQDFGDAVWNDAIWAGRSRDFPRLRELCAQAGLAPGVGSVLVVDSSGVILAGYPAGQEGKDYRYPDDMPDRRPQSARIQIAAGQLFYNRMLTDDTGRWNANLRITADLYRFEPLRPPAPQEPTPETNR